MSWKDTIKDESEQPKVSSWKDTIIDAPEEDDSFLPSMQELKAGAAGAAESFTSGFAPEIAGGVQALASSTFGDDKYSDLLNTYKKYSAEREKDFRALEKENPDAYLTGEIAGGVSQGIATGIATGGLGTAAALASGTAKLPMAMNALKLAGIGAGSGALTGAGYSKESILDAASGDSEAQAGLAKDTVTGAVLGAAGNVAAPMVGKALGKGLEAGGKAVGKVSDSAIKKFKFLEDIRDTYDLVKSGKSVTGSEAKKEILSDVEKISKDLVKGGTEQIEQSSKEMGNILETIEKSDDARQIISYLKDNVDNKNILPDDKAKLKNLIEQYENRTIKETVESSKDLTRKALDKSMRIEEASAPMLGEKVSFPDIKETPDALLALRKKVDQEGLETVSILNQPTIPDKITTEVITKVKDMDGQEAYNIFKSLRDLERSGKLEETGGKAAKEYMNLIGEFLSEKMGTAKNAAFNESKGTMKDAFQARNILPSLDDSSKLGQDTDLRVQKLLLSGNDTTPTDIKRAFGYLDDKFVSPELKESALDIAKRNRLNKIADQEGLFGVSVKAKSIRLGEAAGIGRNVLSKITPKDFTRNLLNYQEDKLYRLATKMPTEFGESMINALKDTTKKDRLLWALAQQPAFREAMNRAEQEEQSEVEN